MNIKLEFDKSALYQWDLNMRVILTDVPVGIEVHYDNINDSEAEYCDTAISYADNGNVYADIPNKVLQLSGTVQVYLYVQEEDKAWTEHKAEFLVLPRKRPANYVYSDAEVKQWDALQKEIKEVKDNLPVDMSENNPESFAYIKNRTHWKEEIERDYTVLHNVEPDPNLGLFKFGKKIGLEIGKEYTVDAYDTSGEIATEQVVIAEAPAEDLGFEGVPYVDTAYISLYDGIDSVEEMPILADNCIYFINNPDIEKVVIRGIPNIETVVHKLPEEYYNKAVVDQTFDNSSKNAQSGIAVKQAIDNIVINTNNLTNQCVTGDKIKPATIEGKHIIAKSLSISKIYNPNTLSRTNPNDISSSFIYFSLTNAPPVNSIKSVIHGEIGLDDTVDKEFQILINGAEKQTIIVPTDGLSKLNVWVSLDYMEIPFFDTGHGYVVLDIFCGDIREKMIIKKSRFGFSISFCTVTPGTNKLVSVMTNDTKLEHTMLHK